MDLAATFGADRADCLAVVGAGGKKSTLYALTAALERAVLTSTVRVPPLSGHVARQVVADDPVAVADDIVQPLAVVPEETDDGRYRGYDPAAVDRLVAAADAPVLVKADGARRRLLKAPAGDEPRLPTAADVVVPVASARVVGERLTDDHVHRPERVADLTGRAIGERLRATDVAAVLAHDRGGLKDVPADATVRPLVNMADDADLEATAREVAAEVAAHSRVEAVVVGRMDLRLVVDVVD